MKVLTIFNKNLKTVARNWNYFMVLFICPVLLILVAGLVLNSSNINNMRIGVFDNDSGYDFNFQNLRYPQPYSSLDDCLYWLRRSHLGACLYVTDMNGLHQIEIYLDNSDKEIEAYAKQFILENVMSDQSSALNTFSDTVSTRIFYYKNYISEARQELINARAELDNQEVTLVSYRNELQSLRNDFNSVYIPLKESRSDVQTLKYEYDSVKANLEGNISYFESKKSEIDSQINGLKSFLAVRLSSGDYSYAAGILDGISGNLDDIGSSLSALSDLYRENPFDELATDLDEIIVRMDQINETFYRIDSDLEEAIEKTRENREKISSFVVKIDAAAEEMGVLSEEVGSMKFTMDFKEAFSISDDIVFLAFPMLVSLIITFTSLVLSNMFILKQINAPSYLRDIITPTGDVSFLIADYLINLFFVSIQASVLFALGYLWFGVGVDILFYYSLSVFFTASVFISVGMGTGYVVKSQNLSGLLTIFLLVFIMILSEILAPVALTGPLMGVIISINPFVIFTEVLTEIFIVHRTFSTQLIFNIQKLCFLFLASFVGVYIARKYNKSRIVS